MTQPSGPIIAVTAAALGASAPLAAALLDLNNAHEVELSRLDQNRLRGLVLLAFMATRIGDVDAFLLAFDQDAPYDSPNFLWFRARLDRFVYVDRVVVAPQARGLGHARRLYAALIDQTRAADQPRIVCEVNAVPPNPASEAFHASLGFEPVGSATLPGGKTVTYLSLEAHVGARP